MTLEICPNCKQPFLSDAKTCPRCGAPEEPYTWDQESWLNAGCLFAMMFFALFLILLPLMFLVGMMLSF